MQRRTLSRLFLKSITVEGTGDNPFSHRENKDHDKKQGLRDGAFKTDYAVEEEDIIG